MISRAGGEANEGSANASPHANPKYGIHDNFDRKRPCGLDVAKLQTTECERHYAEVFRDIGCRRRICPSWHEPGGFERVAANGERGEETHCQIGRNQSQEPIDPEPLPLETINFVQGGSHGETGQDKKSSDSVISEVAIIRRVDEMR